VIGVNKAVGAVLAGALTTIVVYLLNRYIQPPLPSEIGQAIQTILTTVVVYFVPHGGNQ
jgi:large-conductance mechanosensitive channel